MARPNKPLLNTRAVIRVVGMLLIIEAIFMLIPLGVSLYYGEKDWTAFAITIAITVAAGASALSFARPKHRDLGRREGILLTASVWVVFSLYGMIPFMISSVSLGVTDSFFESMSGFTSTGASVLADISDLPRGIHMWRCLMQWIGGMGIIIFTIALIPMFNSSGGMQMFYAEATGITYDKLRPRVSQTAKRLYSIYAVLTVVLIVLLWLGPMSLFDSVCHAFATISTGGFSTSNDALSQWSTLYVKIVIMTFMFLGGINFALLYRLSIGKLRLVWRDEAFRAYVKIIIAVTVFFGLLIVFNGHFVNLEDLVVDPLFHVISSITSTGFSISDFETWGSTVLPMTIILMFMGACAGSTSGGAKLDRLLITWKASRNTLRRNIHPNRFYPLTVNGKSLGDDILNKVVAFLFIYVMLIITGALALSLMGIGLGDACFATFSCVSNAGLGAGATADSFDVIPSAGKWILSFLMLVGRLEIFTVLILLARGFWRK